MTERSSSYLDSGKGSVPQSRKPRLPTCKLRLCLKSDAFAPKPPSLWNPGLLSSLPSWQGGLGMGSRAQFLPAVGPSDPEKAC